MRKKGDKYKIGIIGCGRISQAYFEAINQCSDISLDAVLDTREEAANALAEQANATPFYQLEEYLKKGNVDASIICTPPNTHKMISINLLDSGQHVLCEKPLATSLEDGIHMINIARKNKCQLMMTSKFRHVGDVIQAKSIISSGLLGDILYYENCFSSPVDMSNRWNSDPKVSGGGILIDNGTHSVDIARYLLGPIKSVKTSNLSLSTAKIVEDTVHLSFVTESNIRGTITLSWNIPLDRNAYIGMYGKEGRLRVNWDEASYQYANQNEWVPYGRGYDKVSAFKAQIQNFVESIRGEAKPLISEQESLASIAVVEASYRSLNTGKWEDVAQEYTK